MAILDHWTAVPAPGGGHVEDRDGIKRNKCEHLVTTANFMGKGKSKVKR